MYFYTNYFINKLMLAVNARLLTGLSKVLILAGEGDNCSPRNVQTRVGAHSSSSPVGTAVLSQE
jgi:hypothetical protein